MRRRGQPLGIKTWQGLVPRGRQALLERRTQRGEPPTLPPPCGQLVQSGLGPAAPIKQGVDLCHEGTPRALLGEITGDAPPGRAFGGVQGPGDDQIPRGEATGALRCQPLCGAGRQGHRQTPQKRPEGLVGGSVIHHRIAAALVAAMIDRGEQAEGAVLSSWT